VYTGPWLTDAKKYFSKTSCSAYHIGNKYLNGTAIRQEYLETALDWIWRTETIETTGGIKPLESYRRKYVKTSARPGRASVMDIFSIGNNVGSRKIYLPERNERY
jgi:hypothetical protein